MSRSQNPVFHDQRSAAEPIVFNFHAHLPGKLTQESIHTTNNLTSDGFAQFSRAKSFFVRFN